MFDIMKDRANSNNIQSLNGHTAITKSSKADVLSEIEKSNREVKKRINVSLEESVFDRLITLANGKSVSSAMEMILRDAVKDKDIDEEIVRKYKEKMKNKGQRVEKPKKRKKKGD